MWGVVFFVARPAAAESGNATVSNHAPPTTHQVPQPAGKGTVNSGAEGARTPDLLGAIQALSQLSYSPAREAERKSRPPDQQPLKPSSLAAGGQPRRLCGTWCVVPQVLDRPQLRLVTRRRIPRTTHHAPYSIPCVPSLSRTPAPSASPSRTSSTSSRTRAAWPSGCPTACPSSQDPPTEAKATATGCTSSARAAKPTPSSKSSSTSPPPPTPGSRSSTAAARKPSSSSTSRAAPPRSR